MPTKLVSTGVEFPDGTTQTTRAVATTSLPWTSITGRPTDLGDFTNGPAFMNNVSNCANSAINCTNCGNILNYEVRLFDDGTTVRLNKYGTYTNCACDCYG